MAICPCRVQSSSAALCWPAQDWQVSGFGSYECRAWDDLGWSYESALHSSGPHVVLDDHSDWIIGLEGRQALTSISQSDRTRKLKRQLVCCASLLVGSCNPASAVACKQSGPTDRSMSWANVHYFGQAFCWLGKQRGMSTDRTLVSRSV